MIRKYILLVAITCLVQIEGKNLKPVPGNITLRYQETYTYSCIEGFDTMEDLCATCQPDGTLSIPPPACYGKIINKSYLFMY